MLVTNKTIVTGDRNCRRTDVRIAEARLARDNPTVCVMPMDVSNVTVG